VTLSQKELIELRAEIVRLSGSGKKVAPGRRGHGIYSSITLPGLDDMVAVRDTKQRFVDFGVPESLTGLTWLDLGSNVGAMSFEAAQRGAVVTGVEFRQDRVALCNALSTQYKLGATFYQEDFNDLPEVAPWRCPHHIVLCSSVDEYIDDLESFYGMMHELCTETLYFECNIQIGFKKEDTIACLERAGFHGVEYLGNGHSGGIRRKRKIYRARA
jgi:2-polyprenyl-3-methyl-5-hydroxy-6-metoxy-1,4-benzoquinol methylase